MGAKRKASSKKGSAKKKANAKKKGRGPRPKLGRFANTDSTAWQTRRRPGGGRGRGRRWRVWIDSHLKSPLRRGGR